MIDWIGFALSLLLVAVAVAASMLLSLRLERDIITAAVRMSIQLAIVGGVLGLVIDPDRSIWWSWLWVAAMVGYASDVAARRAPQVPYLRWLALGAFSVAAVVSMAVLFGLGVFQVDGRTVVPLAGMLVGNSMTATVLAGRRVIEELGSKRDQVESRLALGQPAGTAARPYVRAALRDALTPNIETTKATGLVFLPGAMTGLILAGVDPVDAVVVQAVVMFLVLGSVAITTTVVALGATRNLFTADHRLVRDRLPS